MITELRASKFSAVSEARWSLGTTLITHLRSSQAPTLLFLFVSLFLTILQLHKWSGLENQTKPNHSDRCKTQLVWTTVGKRLSATGLLSGLLGQRRVSQPARHQWTHALPPQPDRPNATTRSA